MDENPKAQEKPHPLRFFKFYASTKFTNLFIGPTSFVNGFLCTDDAALQAKVEAREEYGDSIFPVALDFSCPPEDGSGRLAQYLSSHLRGQAQAGRFTITDRVGNLLRELKENIGENQPRLVKERLEKTLNQLRDEGIMGGWKYDTWTDEPIVNEFKWGQTYLNAAITFEAPKELREHYRTRRGY